MSVQNPLRVPNPETVHRQGPREVIPVGLTMGADWLVGAEVIVSIDQVRVTDLGDGTDVTATVVPVLPTIAVGGKGIVAIVRALVTGHDYLLEVDFTVTPDKELTAELKMAGVGRP